MMLILKTHHQSHISLCWLKIVPFGQRKEDLGRALLKIIIRYMIIWKNLNDNDQTDDDNVFEEDIVNVR